MSRWQKWRRRIAWLAIAMVLLVVLSWASMTFLMTRWTAKEPSLASMPGIVKLTPEHRDGRVYLGKNWFGQREGIPVLYVTGTSFEMGYANGLLTQDLIHEQEEAVLALMNRVAPYPWTRFLLKFLVTYKNRKMVGNITPELQLELLGLAQSTPDRHPEMGPTYNRVLNYHAAQDISYMLMNSPLIRPGCTAFGAWGPRATNAHLLCGRNFDWEAAPVFDQRRVVTICEPADGIPFVSLAWAGMAGCVSGMNRAGVSITVNGAPSHLPEDTATPTCVVAREVLQHAHNTAEAIEIIKKRHVFVAAMFLLGSRADGQFIVVEKTPQLTAVRSPTEKECTLICANHYLTPELKNDPLNEQFKRVDTSVSRFDRMSELLKSAPAPLDAQACAAILRDRRLPGGQVAGNGHRGALNPLIATHSVVMDLTSGIFWASAPPHQLGKFVAININDPEKLMPEMTVGADPILTNGEYDRFLASQTNLTKGWQALKSGRLDAALDCARQAETNNPGFYQNSWLMGEVLLRKGDLRNAAVALQKALDGKPALAHERRRITQLQQESTK